MSVCTFKRLFTHFRWLSLFNDDRMRNREREIRNDTIATKTSLSEYSKQIELKREIRLCGGG